MATETYDLTYEDLKRFARADIEHSFLPGGSLWQAPEDFSPVADCAGDSPSAEPSASCRRFLDSSERTRMQWRLEQQFTAFEGGF